MAFRYPDGHEPSRFGFLRRCRAVADNHREHVDDLGAAVWEAVFGCVAHDVDRECAERHRPFAATARNGCVDACQVDRARRCRAPFSGCAVPADLGYLHEVGLLARRRGV